MKTNVLLAFTLIPDNPLPEKKATRHMSLVALSLAEIIITLEEYLG
jgi:hypothetical protein